MASPWKGNLEAPVCTDCHGEHDILLHNDPKSPVAFANLSARVCSPCHSSVKLSTKYGLVSDRPRSFQDSYHGLAIRGGSIEAANCASCHGAHHILPSADRASSVNKANLSVTCGKCHQGANERFAKGFVHVVVTQQQEPVIYWIAMLYTGTILLVVGGMFAHNLLDYLEKTTRRIRHPNGAIHEEGLGQALYLRMNLTERLQHIALVLSFTVLVVTGFMLHYPESWWVKLIRSVSVDAFEYRSLAHRIAAVVMVAAGIFHIGYAGFTTRGRQFLREILPARRDLWEAIGQVGWNIGLAKRRPRFGRFSYIEKSEYWALVWGTAVMTATGAILWFENTFIGLLGKLGWDISRTIHFYEAILAALAILVWHIYYVVFNPDVYPMNPAWITGYLTEAQMAEEHPRELEAILLHRKEDAIPASDPAAPETASARVAAEEGQDRRVQFGSDPRLTGSAERAEGPTPSADPAREGLPTPPGTSIQTHGDQPSGEDAIETLRPAV